jgi:hypothetical protein
MKKLVFTLLALFSLQAYADADWLTPNGMTKVMEGVDDDTFHVPLGHTFPYYGGIFTDAWMSSNGFILLYDPTTQFGNFNTGNSMCCSGYDLSNWSPQQGGQFSFMLAPLWTDLVDRNLTPDDGYYYQTDKGGSSFLWYNVNEFYNDNKNTFQVNLWPDGSFDFLYDEVDTTEHSVFMGFTGDITKNEINQLGYYQSGVTEFDIGFHSQTVNGGKAWYGNDGGYGSTLDCSDALNDPQCPGYEQAYYEQQCSYDALYDFGCQGYEQAYLDLQCSYDELYDSMCPGYDNAILVQNLSGQDFVFGDDISDFYDTDPIDETDMFPLYEEETNMFTSYEEETNMFTEPEIYEEPIEETYFEETVEEAFFDEPVMAAVEEETYEEEILEEEIFEEVIDEEHVQIEEQITHVEEDVGSIEEELPITEVEVQESVVEREILVRESGEVSTPSVDAVSIALNTAATAESTSLSVSTEQNESSMVSTQTLVENTITEQEQISIDQIATIVEEQISIDQIATIVEEQISLQETNLQNFSASVTSEDDVQDTISDTLSQELDVNDSEIALYDNSTFGSIDSAFGDAIIDMIVDPSITTVEISAVQPVTEQATQEESSIEFQMESSTTQIDTGFAAQQNQSFSTGQSITAVLNNVAPNFSQFDVAPPSQQEQQTAQKAESQANNMSDEQLEENLDEFSDQMKDSGGFTDQSMTIFLMGRNSNFSQYAGQLQDVSFYTDRGMPGGSIQSDRNSMLRMMGTDNKHEQLIAEQYK